MNILEAKETCDGVFDYIEDLEHSIEVERAIILHLEYILWKASTGDAGRRVFLELSDGMQKEYFDIARQQLQSEGILP